MEVVPQVHWLKAGYANVYLCVEEAGLTLVDSGPPKRADAILEYVTGLGREASEIRTILITHADWDHAGSMAALQARTGATIVAAPPTAEYLRRGRAPKHMPWPLSFVVDLIGRYEPAPEVALTTAPAGTVLPVLGELHVLATPGHTSDHHSFYSPDRGVLFAGDALGTRSGKVSIAPDFITANRTAARRSARWLLRLSPELFACGHGPPLAASSASELDRLQEELGQS